MVPDNYFEGSEYKEGYGQAKANVLKGISEALKLFQEETQTDP